MRIKYIIPSKPSPSYINIEMWQMLVHELTVCDQVDIVDMSPDIVHIWHMELTECTPCGAISKQGHSRCVHLDKWYAWYCES